MEQGNCDCRKGILRQRRARLRLLAVIVVTLAAFVLASCKPPVGSGPGTTAADQVLPAPTLGGSSGSSTGTDSGLTNKSVGLVFSGSGAQPGDTVDVVSDGTTVIGTATVDSSGTWTVTTTTTLSDGTHKITIRVTDSTGTVVATSSAYSITVDTTPPAQIPTLLTPHVGAYTGHNLRPVFIYAGTAAGDTADIEASTSKSFASPAYTWTGVNSGFRPSTDMAVSTTQPVGTRYYFRIRARDAAGNVGPWSTTDASIPLRYAKIGRYIDDFNGDGYSDFAASAPQMPGSPNYQGKVWLYFGPNPTTAADVTVSGSSSITSDQFGIDVAFVGDLNGDGYADLAVSAPDPTVQTVYIFYGSKNPPSSLSADNADVTLKEDITANGATLQTFGMSIAGAGDINADGYDDLLVAGEDYVDYTYTKYAAVDVFLGGSSGPKSTPDAVMKFPTNGLSFGSGTAVR